LSETEELNGERAKGSYVDQGGPITYSILSKESNLGELKLVILYYGFNCMMYNMFMFEFFVVEFPRFLENSRNCLVGLQSCQATYVICCAIMHS